MSAPEVALELTLPPPVMCMTAWLAERWQSDVATVVSDILVHVSCGRHRLAQLIQHNLQPRQIGVDSNASVVQVRLLAPTVRRLQTRVQLHWADEARALGMLIQEHLIGCFNSQSATLTQTDPDGNLLRTDDSDIKIHLTDTLINKADDLSLLHELTRSDVLRNCLLLHVYGRLRYEQWTAEGSWRPKRKATASEKVEYALGDIKFSPQRVNSENEISAALPATPISTKLSRTDFILKHGKSTEPTRVFLPHMLKERLESLAQAKRVPVSEYCRKHLVNVI